MMCLVVGIMWASAQTQRVTGTVISEEDGLPVIGASVLVKGTQVGTITDMDGKFVMTDVPSSAKLLVVSYIGMRTQEVGVAPTLRVVLKPATEMIDEVVVVAYGTQKRQSVVGAQSSVSSKDLEKRPITNVTSALSGAASGVQVTTSTGQPGESSTLRIRGFGSINASSAPLYVVDGAIYNGALGDIAPADIQSISILKDAASTALYGSSAGNGVILITTKSGMGARDGKPKFTFTMNQGATRRGQADYEKVGAMDHYTMRWQQWFNQEKYSNGRSDDLAGKLAAYYVYRDLRYNPYAGLKSVYEENPETGEITMTNNPHQGWDTYPAIVTPDGKLNPEINGLLWGDDMDWEKALFRTGYRSEYSLSGGLNTDKMKSFMSISYLGEEGYKRHTSFQRFSGRGNLSYDVNKWFSIGSNVSFSRVHNTAPKTASDSYSSNPFYFKRGIAPIYPIHRHKADGSYELDEQGNKIYDHNYLRPYIGGFNPVQEGELDHSTFDRDAITSRSFAEFTFIPELKLRTNLSYDLVRGLSKKRYNNIMGDQPAGYLQISDYRYSTITFNQLLSYKKSFGLHNFDAMLGHEIYWLQMQSTDMRKKGMGILGIDEMPNLSTPVRITSGTDTYSKEGYFGRVNYDLDSRYNLSISYRRDGTSRMAPDKRWGNFWSFGAGWNIAQEAFAKKDWLDELKLRASIGQTGNDLISWASDSDEDSYYAYRTLYELGYNNGDYPGVRLVELGNSDLRWETQTSTDIAVEFGVFNRLRGTVEFFNKESKDLIFGYPLPESSGAKSINRNIGKVRNYGLEFELQGTLVSTKDFKWNLSLNGTILKNKIVRLPDENRKDGIEFNYNLNSAVFFLVRKFYMLRCLLGALYFDMRCFGVFWVFSKHKIPHPNQWGSMKNHKK